MTVKIVNYRTARICERWDMEIAVPATEHNEWFLDWVLRAPTKAGVHLTAGWHAYQSLLRVYGPGDIYDAVEYFGGMGAQALMIQHLFDPSQHTVMDYAPEAALHMRTVLPDWVEVRQADAYHSFVRADLVGLDFGDLTAWKTRDGEPHRVLMDRVFAAEPKAVVLTDIACRYLHLHQKRYETLLGPDTCGSYGTYLRALLARIEALYGYSLVAGFWDRWSTVMALVPSDKVTGPGELVETPESPRGLVL